MFGGAFGIDFGCELGCAIPLDQERLDALLRRIGRLQSLLSVPNEPEGSRTPGGGCFFCLCFRLDVGLPKEGCCTSTLDFLCNLDLVAWLSETGVVLTTL